MTAPEDILTATLYYQNVRGLRTKSPELLCEISSCSYDIICLTETWLNEEIPSSLYFTPRYAVFRKDRDYRATGQKYGGGALIAIDCGYNAIRRSDLEDEIECVWTEIPVADGLNILLGNYYFCPGFSADNFIAHFDSLLNRIDFSKYRVQIYGDFNLPGIRWDCPALTNSDSATARKASCLLDLVNFCDFYQYNRNVSSSGNVLDLALSTFAISTFEAVDEPLSRIDLYHVPFKVTFAIPLIRRSYAVYQYLSYKNGDYFGLYNYLLQQSMESIVEDNNADSAARRLTDIVSTAIDRFIPLKQSRKQKYPVWFSKELKILLRRKLHYHRLFKKNSSQLWYHKYSEARALSKKLFTRDKALYEETVERNLRCNPTSFWRYVRKHKREKCDAGITLRDQSVLLSDPEKVSNAFAAHFGSCVLPCFSDVDARVESSYTDFLPLTNVTEEEVRQAIRRLKPKTSSGIDGIPNFIVKGCCDILLQALLHIFNVSLCTGVYPSCWKTAVIIPVHKSGDPCNVSNYRPVSLLCAFSKIFEIVIYDRLYRYFGSKISTEQCGFMKGRSVESNLCTFLEYTAPFVCNRKQVDTIYFDLSKAFDRVNHDVLLLKLKHYGLDDRYCIFLKTYLTDRINIVRVGRTLSTPFISNLGVPQGSNLGPLLFSIFVNDVTTVVRHSKLLLFADDMKIYRSVSSLADCISVQRDASAIYSWCKVNHLTLNISKTRVVSFTRRHSKLEFQYLIDGVPVSRVEVIRDLGVNFDSALRFDFHVSHVYSTCMRMFGLICRISIGFHDFRSLIALYYSLVRSRLEFASTVWNCLTKTQSECLERIQQKLVRVVYDRFHNRVWYFNYDNLLSKLDMISLRKRRLIRDLTFFYKIVHGTVDAPSLLYAIDFHVPARRSRYSSVFYPKSRELSCPLVRMQCCYNDLNGDGSIDIFSNFSSFQSSIMTSINFT